MEKLTELLNYLLGAGWKPFNRDKTLHIDCYDKCKGLNYKWIHLDGGFMNEESRTLRELVSVDSGLWQFVCENGMVKIGSVFISWTKNASCDDYGNLFWDKACPKDFYQYRLIESALRDESELEDFLLQNIKIEGIS